MPTIDISDVSQYTVSGSFDIASSFKADAESTEQKVVTLRFVMKCVPLAAIVRSSLKDKRINWAVSARRHFDKIVDRSTIVVNYVGAGAALDPVSQVVANAEALGISPDEYIRLETAKRQQPKLEKL